MVASNPAVKISEALGRHQRRSEIQYASQDLSKDETQQGVLILAFSFPQKELGTRQVQEQEHSGWGANEACQKPFV